MEPTSMFLFVSSCFHFLSIPCIPSHRPFRPCVTGATWRFKFCRYCISFCCCCTWAIESSPPTSSLQRAAWGCSRQVQYIISGVINMPKVQYFSLETPRFQFLLDWLHQHLSRESLIWNGTHPRFWRGFNRWLFHILLFPLLHAPNLFWYPSAQHRSPNFEGWRPDQGPRFHRNHVCLILDPSRLLVLLTYLHEIDEKNSIAMVLNSETCETVFVNACACASHAMSRAFGNIRPKDVCFWTSWMSGRLLTVFFMLNFLCGYCTNTYSPTQSKVSFRRFPYSKLVWGHSKTKTCSSFIVPFGGVHNTNPRTIHLAKQSCAQGPRPFFFCVNIINIIQNAHERVASLSWLFKSSETLAESCSAPETASRAKFPSRNWGASKRCWKRWMVVCLACSPAPRDQSSESKESGACWSTAKSNTLWPLQFFKSKRAPAFKSTWAAGKDLDSMLSMSGVAPWRW